MAAAYASEDVCKCGEWLSIASNDDINCISPFISADHVTTDSGTGIVHTAPGHGQDDFIAWNKYIEGRKDVSKVPIICPVDDEGKYTHEIVSLTGGQLASLEGVQVVHSDPESTANPAVIEHLDKIGALVSHEKYKHRYPCDWRTKQPTIVRATRQWFLDIGGDIRHGAREALEKVEMVPATSRNRLESMVEGVTIGAFLDKGTGVCQFQCSIGSVEMGMKWKRRSWQTRRV